jgi:hypothetical protein
MNNPRSTLLIILAISVIAIPGCVPAPPGMDLYALQTHQVTPFTKTGVPLGFRSIEADWVSDIGYNANGPNEGTHFLITLNGGGRAHVNNTRLPATWDFSFLFPTVCVHPRIREAIEMHDPNGGFALLECERIDGIHPFGFAPDTADAQAMPASFEASGEGIDGTYGMPRVDFYDEYGRLVVSTYATYVGSDGAGSTWLGGGMPSLQYSCTYTVAVNNVLSDGSTDIVGVATVYVINGLELPPPVLDPPPDPTPDPCGLNPCLVY